MEAGKLGTEAGDGKNWKDLKIGIMRIIKQVNWKERFGPESCILELAIIGWRTYGTDPTMEAGCWGTEKKAVTGNEKVNGLTSESGLLSI